MAKTALDRLSSRKNLEAIWNDYRSRAIKSAAGVNKLTPQKFDDSSDSIIKGLSHELRSGYSYSLLRGVRVPKTDPTKFRIICIPTIQDRIVQRAVLKEIETKAQKLGIANEVSFGFVKNTGHVKRGANTARDTALRHRRSKPWAFKADIEAFFDRIDRAQLSTEFIREFSLRSLTPLVVGAIGCEVDDSDPRIRRVLQDNKITRGVGLRQGMPLSPTLSNFVLRNFDRAFICKRYDLVRYADDLLVLASSRGECEAIEELTRLELAKLGLKVSEAKTTICEPEQPVDFLGMELGRSGTDGSYSLRISEKQKLKIREQFTNFHDLDYIRKEDLNAHTLADRLIHMAQGYKAAYSAASNFDEVEQQFAQWHQNCFIKVYERLFGSGAISKLSALERKFLMI